MASVRDTQLILSLWVVYLSVVVDKLMRVYRSTFFWNSFSFSLSGFFVLVSTEAALVLSAELGLYESLAFLLAVLFYILQSDAVVVTPAYPKDAETETDAESQVEAEQILETSASSLFVINGILLAMMILLTKTGLSILNPPDELTQEVLNMEAWDRKLIFDWAFGKILILTCLSVTRYHFTLRWTRLVITVIHVGFLTVIWYGWSTSTAPNSFNYGIFLAIEVWDGRHLLYLLSLVSVVLQHSLTRREQSILGPKGKTPSDCEMAGDTQNSASGSQQ